MGFNNSKNKSEMGQILSQENTTNKKIDLDKTINELEEKIKRLKGEQELMGNLLSHIFVKNKNKVEARHEIYDIMIDIDCLTTLNDGWKITTNPKSLAKYNEKKDKNSLIISIMGSIKKGKSYIMSQLTDEPLPNGYNLSTKGLCLKYPTIHKNNIIIMDTPGLDFSPIFSTSNTKEEVEKIMKNKEKTIEFLQKFIILNSNIIVCVVGEMTIDDQKNIERIKNHAKTNQIVIIVHNLYTYPSSESIQTYLEKIISQNEKNLQKNTYIKLIDTDNDEEKKKKSQLEENNIYYNENYNRGNINLNLIHVILANQNTQAGSYYNKSSISFIRNIMCSQPNHSSFPVFEKLKQFIVDQYPILFGKQISPELIAIDEDKKISLKYNQLKKNEELPKIMIRPKYCYYITNKEIIIRVECSNNATNAKVKCNTKGSNTIITLSGIKTGIDNNEKDENKPSFNNIMCGQFIIEILIPLNDVVFASHTHSSLSKNNGYLQIKYLKLTND